ncbi:MAG: GIY-YIG nuclease family protein [Patescibacteria group bacterium]
MHYAYILHCADGTYYVGYTTDLERRLHTHNHLKSGAHYTKIRRPVVMVYSKKFRTLAKARAKEAEWKRLTRAEKREMIERG